MAARFGNVVRCLLRSQAQSTTNAWSGLLRCYKTPTTSSSIALRVLSSSASRLLPNADAHHIDVKDAKDDGLPPCRNSLAERVKSEMLRDQQREFLFAVVHIAGKQYKVTKGDCIVVQRIPADIGDRIKFEKVLLVGGKEFTLFGKPLLSRELVNIEGVVVEKMRGKKLIVFKMKRRKGYKRKKGHRQRLAIIKIDDLTLDPSIVDREP